MAGSEEREKTVHEIDVTAARDPLEQRAGGLGDLDLVQADLRNLQAGLFGEADDLAGKNPQAGRATVELLALLEQRLVTDADAEKGPAGFDEAFDTVEESLSVHRLDAIVEGADAGEHGGARVVQAIGRTGHAHVRADFLEGLLHAAQVARTVIKQGNHNLS